MSFIFQDKNFLNLIYKMAQETGATAGTVPLSEELINKIFDNLKQQKESSKFQSITGADVADRASADQAAFDQPSVKDITNLNSFLPFCQKAQIKVSGNDIVKDTEVPVPQGDGWKPYPGASRPKFYVNVPALSLYLEFLKSSEDYKTNKVYIYMLGELIRQANVAFSTNVSTLEDEVIASLTNPVDIAKTLEQNKGNIQLKVGDLRGFDDWYKKTGMSVNNNGAPVQAEKDAKCALLKYLHDNAQDKHKPMIKSCAGNLGCPVGQWSSQATPQTSQPQQGGQQGQQTQLKLSPIGLSALQNLIRILNGGGPFESDRVFIGNVPDEKVTDSLVSFCNNCELYFNAMSESYVGTASATQFDTLATKSKTASGLLWNLKNATQESVLMHGQQCTVYSSRGQDTLDWLFSQGVVGMNETLMLVYDVCRLNNLQDKFQTQKYNHGRSVSIVNSVKLTNRIPTRR